MPFIYNRETGTFLPSDPSPEYLFDVVPETRYWINVRFSC